MPSRYEDREGRDEKPRWHHGEGDSDEEKRFEEEFDDRFGRGRGRGRGWRRFDDEDDDFGRDALPRFDDNPFRRIDHGDRPGRSIGVFNISYD